MCMCVYIYIYIYIYIIWGALLVQRYLCNGGRFVLYVFLCVPRHHLKHHLVKNGPLNK